MPLLHGGRPNWPEDVFIQISEAETGRAVRTHRWKYAVTAAPDKTGSHMGASDYREAFLYDLAYDPYELCNLIEQKSHRPVASVMRNRLWRRMQEAGEERPHITMAAVTPSGQRYLTEFEKEQ